ncbi:MAG: hypothetical protein M3297_11655 [Thermoproteota archaeon]|nr:hypothetical protein [Thermoproteota archaeon]
MSQDRLYSCRHCGAEYVAYPPDDIHSESNVNEVPDSIAIPYHCTKCAKENKLHWTRPIT